MKVQQIILIAFLLSTGMKSSYGIKIQSTQTVSTVKTKENLKTSPSIDSILIESRVEHEFSQIDKKDEFYICIRGKSIVEGRVIFKIVRSDKTVILEKEFPTYLLMNYGFDGDLNSIKDREKYMISRIEEFFNEKNFLYPAIKKDEQFDQDYSDKETWDEIKSDQTAIGFSYLVGEEDGRKIAFSKKQKKVVMYFNCC